MHQATKLGLFLIAIFVVASELSVAFHGLLFPNALMSRNAVLLLLWMLPPIAASVVAYRVPQKKLLSGAPLAIALISLGPGVHLLAGMLGAKTDLAGVEGFWEIMQIYSKLGIPLILAGSVVGTLVSAQD